MEAGDTVRVDCAEVCGLKHGRGEPRVIAGNSEVLEDARGEVEEAFRRIKRRIGHSAVTLSLREPGRLRLGAGVLHQ